MLGGDPPHLGQIECLMGIGAGTQAKKIARPNQKIRDFAGGESNTGCGNETPGASLGDPIQARPGLGKHSANTQSQNQDWNRQNAGKFYSDSPLQWSAPRPSN